MPASTTQRFRRFTGQGATINDTLENLACDGFGRRPEGLPKFV